MIPKYNGFNSYLFLVNTSRALPVKVATISMHSERDT